MFLPCVLTKYFMLYLYITQILFFFIMIKIIGKNITAGICVYSYRCFLLSNWYIIYYCLENVYESLLLPAEELANITVFFPLEPEHMGYSKNFHSFRDVLFNFFFFQVLLTLIWVYICVKRGNRTKTAASLFILSPSPAV